MNLQRLAALVAAVVLLLALGWWQVSDPQADALGHPTAPFPPLRSLVTDVPPLAPFMAFNVNDENPFVPWQLRPKERAKPSTPPVAPSPPPPPPPTFRRPYGPVVVKDPPIKPVVWPKLTPAEATAPQCIGLVGGEEAQLLVVRMPGAESSVTLKIGAIVDGWTLVMIDNSNQAHFTDPSGAAQVFPIGDGDLAVAQSLVAPASDAPSKPSKPGESALIKDLLGVPKPIPPGQNGKGQGGQDNGPRKPRRPGGQGQAPGGGDNAP